MRVSAAVPPVEPPPCIWALPDPLAADADGICGVGADLEPGTLVAAYRQGLFPMHIDRRARAIGWWSPDPRGVLPPGRFHESRTLRRVRSRFETTVDTAFAEVIAACAAPRPTGGHWIHPSIVSAYTELHRLGWAHSIEVWDTTDGRLAGGMYGVAIGGLFAGESMFHRVTNASKVAVAAAVDLLEPDSLFDVQWATPHLQSLGAVAIPAVEYLTLLRDAIQRPLPKAFA